MRLKVLINIISALPTVTKMKNHSQDLINYQQIILNVKFALISDLHDEYDHHPSIIGCFINNS